MRQRFYIAELFGNIQRLQLSNNWTTPPFTVVFHDTLPTPATRPLWAFFFLFRVVFVPSARALSVVPGGRVLIQFQEVKNWLRNINMNVVFSVKSIIGFFAFRCIDPPAEGNDLFFAIVRQWPV